MTPSLRGAFKLAFKGGILFLTLAGIILLAAALDITHLDADWMDGHIRNRGHAGMALFVALAAVASAVGVPRQGISFLGGYAFGAALGVLLSTLGTTLGCALGFTYARLLGRSVVMRLFGRRLAGLNAFLARAPFSMTLVVRCLPVGNNAVTNLLGGLSSIPALSFIAGSFVGYIPQNLIFSILGSGMRVDPFWRIALSAVLFIFSSIFGYMLYRRHKIPQTLEPEPAETQRGLNEM